MSGRSLQVHMIRSGAPNHRPHTKVSAGFLKTVVATDGYV